MYENHPGIIRTSEKKREAWFNSQYAKLKSNNNSVVTEEPVKKKREVRG